MSERDFDRTERIGAEMQRLLAALIRDEVKDPNLANLTIQEVRVTRDLAHAKVYFTCFPDDEGAEEQERLLNGRIGAFLRRRLGQEMRLRTIPQLHFIHDTSIARGERLLSLIEEAVAKDRAKDGEVD